MVKIPEFDFCKNRKTYFIISGVIIALIVILSFVMGVDMSIEFRGGTIISYSYTGDIDTAAVEAKASEISAQKVITRLGEDFSSGSKTIELSFSSKEGLTAEKQADLSAALKEQFADNGLELFSSSDVNPSSGIQFFQKCLVAVLLAAVVLIIYIAFRFKKISGWSAGVFAIVALIHDCILVYGAFVIFGFGINANFMAVVLTILGYSINDTIVIYDRLRENQKIYGKKLSVSELVNKSVNQSLTRTLNTSITTVMAMVVVSIVAMIFNVQSILSFSVPMIIGMISGVYSTICIACPLWVTWKEHSGNKNGQSGYANKKKA